MLGAFDGRVGESKGQNYLRLQTRVLCRVVGLVSEALLVDAAAVVDVLGGGEAQEAESESEGGGEKPHGWGEKIDYVYLVVLDYAYYITSWRTCCAVTSR